MDTCVVNSADMSQFFDYASAMTAWFWMIGVVCGVAIAPHVYVLVRYVLRYVRRKYWALRG